LIFEFFILKFLISKFLGKTVGSIKNAPAKPGRFHSTHDATDMA